MSTILEIACFDTKSCLIAEQTGAHRIEFCANYSVGGITPLFKDILKVKEQIRIPLHVIIRPRSGNFCYTTRELDQMKEAIVFCKMHQIDGVVFGVLTHNNEIDEEANKLLVQLAKPLTCTFHRAIDSCKDMDKAFTQLIKLGFNNVLTSGGKATAEEGVDMIAELQHKYGKQISIIPGGGIRSENIKLIARKSNCKTFHSSALNLNSKTISSHILSELLQAINS